MDAEKRGPVPLSLLVVVVDRDRRNTVQKLMEGHKAFFNLVSFGLGTANSRILSYLGLGQTEKAVSFHILPSPMAEHVCKRLDEELELKKPGRGISFMADINHGCYHRPVSTEPEQGGEESMDRISRHDLVFVVVNRGYTEEVMDAARAVGATGGTVLHAKGCGLEGAEKFFGITIQPEKEIILIVAKNEDSCAIMQAVADHHGPGTDASAVSFSMPVTAVKGVGSDVPADIGR